MEQLCKIRTIYRAIIEFENCMEKQHGLSLNEGMLLCSLLKQPGITSTELAELLGLTCSNCSKVISSVEKKGYVERTLGDADKRHNRFTLTATGAEKLQAMKCCSNELPEVLKELL
ncbi:MAG: MarR family winged helix-turn-helix transcriptional regulator [Marinifilaceae bacterium]